MIRPVFVVHAKRSAIGKFLGSFQETPQPRMLAPLIRQAMSDLQIPGEAVDEVIAGLARGAGVGPNPGRQAAMFAGLPVTVPAWTLNMACGSSLKAVIDAGQKIAHGEAELIIAGGAENMSRVPFLLPGLRTGYRLGNQPLLDGMYQDGFLCPISGKIMGETAETLAEQYGISREDQDQFALQSQQKTAAATAAGKYREEIQPLTVAGRKGETLVSLDEHPRSDASLDNLRKLPAVFKKDGTVTAGNSSGLTDGAALLILCSEAKLKEFNLAPLARFAAGTQAGVPAEIMGIGPVPAVRKLFAKTKLDWKDIGLLELNEAFAAQVIACRRDLQFPDEILNVNGGAIALGHPIGATGARICVTLIHEMNRRKVQRGIATLCISGGMGVAALFERV